MGNKRAKILGILVILVAFLIASFNSLSVTSLSILDTDASTYIIVVMLMIFLFIVFSAKADIDFEYNKKNIIYSAAIFIAYVLIVSYVRVGLSSAFLSYRIDALLFPLPLLSFIVLVFGPRGAKKLSPLVLYSLFASPLILMPLLNLNNAFANLNAIFVYNIIKSTGVQVSRLGLVISSSLGSSITISSTCVSLGTFVAFVMFLVPIAYLYDGKKINKLYWGVSGVLLILVLNFLRMLSIAIIWVYYGISHAVNTFHLFAGQLIFYIAIILMVFFTYKYGLGLRKAKKGTLKDIKSLHLIKDKRLFLVTIIALVFAIVAFALNSGYYSNVYAPAIFFGTNTNASSLLIYHQVLAGAEASNGSIAVLSTSGTNYLFLLGNLSDPNESAYAVANVTYSPLPYVSLPGYIPTTGPHSYLLKNGISVAAQSASSGNSLFEINYFSLPYNLSGSWFMVNYVVFEKVNPNSPSGCSMINYNSIGSLDYIESEIYNLIATQQLNANKGFICSAYMIASSR